MYKLCSSIGGSKTVIVNYFVIVGKNIFGKILEITMMQYEENMAANVKQTNFRSFAKQNILHRI